jgi:hypothetical protein
MGEWKATTEFVGDLANGRKIDRRSMLWLISLLQIKRQIKPKVREEATDDELREKIMATRSFIGWGLRQECYPAAYCQKVREVSAPADSPICGLCKKNKAADAKIEDKPPYEKHLGIYLCHPCKYVELKPPKFEGGTWTMLPFGLPEAEDKFAAVIGRILDRKADGRAYT